MGRPRDFATIFHKVDNFCGFLFAFLHTARLLKKGLLCKEGSMYGKVYSVRKEFAGSKFLPYRVNTFQKGVKTILTVTDPKNVTNLLKVSDCLGLIRLNWVCGNAYIKIILRISLIRAFARHTVHCK